MTKVKVINETATQDGNYSALVSYYGMEYAVSFVNNDIRLHATGGQSRRPKWQRENNVKVIREFIQRRIFALGPVFLDNHDELYKN